MSYRYNPLSGKIEFVGISTADGTSLEATINEKVANLVDSAPATLDTLNELAAALNNDPDFATSTATLLGEKALATDLASLAASLTTVATSGSYADLTGTPTLANIATSGSYADLTGSPTNLSDFTNDEGFITGYTVTQSDVTDHESALTITESQISDLGTYLVASDLSTYATQSYVGSQGFITGYTVTESDVTGHESALTITESQISDLGSYLVSADLSTYATQAYVGAQGFITGYTVTESDVTGHQTALSITESQISDLGSYLVSTDLNGYATESYVDSQGFITGYTVTESDVTGHQTALSITESQISDLGSYLVAADLSSYATQAYVSSQGFITGYTVTESDVTGHQAALSITESQISDLGTYLVADDLSSYATQSYVGSQGFITGYTVTESDVTSHESALTITESQISDLGTYLVADDLSTYALKTYVDTQVAGVVNSAPEALNTLNELAAALGNDDDFATTVTNSLSEKANTANLSTVATSGAYSDLSGTPTNLNQFTNGPEFISDYTVTQSDVTDHQAALSITESQISDLQSYLTSVSEASVTAHQAALTITESQISDLQSYLTSVSESAVTAHQAALSITESQISDLGTYLVADDLSSYATEAYVGSQGFITDYTVTESDVTGHQAALSITESQISDLGTYLVAADLSDYATQSYVGSQGFITDYTVTQSDVTGHQSALSITESQISDLGTYATLSDFEVTSLAASGAGSLNYDNSTGTFTFEPADLDGYLTTATAASTYATTTYVNTQVAGIVSSAPETLDTLNELAAALDDDPNFATTVTNQIAAKPDLDDFSVTSLTANGAGSLNYDKTTGTFTFEPADLSGYLTSATAASTYTTESYVNQKVADLVDSSPTTLDTLNELAAALDDDPNFAATVTTQLGTKATLASFEVNSLTANGAGSLNYDDSTGIFTFEPANLSGYLTEEQDPVFQSSVASGIAPQHIQQWNTAYTWGDHGEVGYLTSQTQADYNQTDSNAVDFIKNKPTIPTVPTNLSGFNNDTNFITISSVPTELSDLTNDIGLITLTQSRSGVSVFSGSASGAGSLNYDNTTGTFTFQPADLSGFLTSQTQADYNQTDSSAVDYILNKPTIPTALSDLTNDENFISAGGLSVSLGDANGSGSLNYNAGTGVFTFAPADLSNYLTTISYAEVTDKPTLFDGDYTNLTNQPTIPTNNNELINGAGYLALVSAPSTSKGASGDAAGDVAMDDNYIYRCTANYTDGVADIWKRVAFSTDTW